MDGIHASRVHPSMVARIALVVLSTLAVAAAGSSRGGIAVALADCKPSRSSTAPLATVLAMTAASTALEAAALPLLPLATAATAARGAVHAARVGILGLQGLAGSFLLKNRNAVGECADRTRARLGGANPA